MIEAVLGAMDDTSQPNCRRMAVRRGRSVQRPHTGSMTGRQKLLTTQETRALVNATLADPTVDLAFPLGISLALREGLPTTVLTTLSRGDYHPAVGDVPGSLTYRDGGQVRVVRLSPEPELLLSAYLER